MDSQESFVQSRSVPTAIPRGVSGWAHPYNVGGFNPTVLQVYVNIVKDLQLLKQLQKN